MGQHPPRRSLITPSYGNTWDIRVDYPRSNGRNQFQDELPPYPRMLIPIRSVQPSMELCVYAQVRASRSGRDRTFLTFAMNRITRLDPVALSEPGVYEAAWNGTDENGIRVATGLYFTGFHPGETINAQNFWMLD